MVRASDWGRDNVVLASAGWDRSWRRPLFFPQRCWKGGEGNRNATWEWMPNLEGPNFCPLVQKGKKYPPSMLTRRGKKGREE